MGYGLDRSRAPNARTFLWIVAASLVVAAGCGGADDTASSAERASFPRADTGAPAASGVIDLAGPWRYRAGDSPTWAAPDFDDSDWAVLEIPEQPGIADRPRGEIVWFRRSVALGDGGADAPLSLLLGRVIGACEVFVDGVRAGSVGSFEPLRYPPLTTVHVIDVPERAVGRASRLLVAIRLRQDATLAEGPGPGPSRLGGDFYLLGPRDVIHALQRLANREQHARNVVAILVPVVGCLLGALLSGFLYLRRRDQKTHLLFAGTLAALGLHQLLTFLQGSTDLLGSVPLGVVLQMRFALVIAEAIAFVELSSLLFDGRRPGRVVRAFQLACLLVGAAGLVSASAIVYLFSHQAMPLIFGGSFAACLGMAARSARRGQREAYVVLGGFVVAMGLMVWSTWLVANRPHEYGAMLFPPWAAAMLVLGLSMAVALIEQFVRTLGSAEEGERSVRALNAELSDRMAQLETQKREVDGLNADLRRQIALRSKQLAESLATLEAVPPISMILDPGMRILDRYRVVRKLGRGGMGAVHEVERMRDGARFALKVLSESTTGEQLSRFAREAQIAAQIDHPNVVAVRDFDLTPGGAMYVVMDLVRGDSLEGLRPRFGDVAWAMPLLRQVLEGLDALHRAGVIHRDLKPGNVMVDEQGRAKITDFGIALTQDASSFLPSHVPPAPAAPGTSVDPHGATVAAVASIDPSAATQAPARGAMADERPSEPLGSTAPRLTQAGAWMGTPSYMAPELAAGAKEASAASDLWAFAVMACEMLTGRPPFDELPMFAAVAGSPLPSPRVELADEAIRDLLLRCLDPSPRARPSLAEMRAGLGGPPSERAEAHDAHEHR